ncbi:unnamed protein product [Mytilus coruscus]|uniref:Uncharacterized protein n=1 Tax=Mytilus coruscus TaxID=42192 RepID=A0A6J8F4K9_MYTCO|nr:unnamed protein product [Mytilus coruscus]
MLMKDVLRNLKCSHNIVGLRALEVCNKFRTTRLWKIIEADNTHILDMNAHYHDLIKFLEDVATNVESANKILTGEKRPFSNIKTKKDEVWEILVKQQTSDAETLVLEQSADKKTFQKSRFEGKPVTVDMLMSNLEILIRLQNVSEVEVEETLTEE